MSEVSICALCAHLHTPNTQTLKPLHISQAHVKEWSDLNEEARQAGMALLLLVEKALRQHLAPCKINLASLGNQVAHVHWHSVARFEWDSHFPQSIWGPAQRPLNTTKLAALSQKLPLLDAALKQVLGAVQ